MGQRIGSSIVISAYVMFWMMPSPVSPLLVLTYTALKGYLKDAPWNTMSLMQLVGSLGLTLPIESPTPRKILEFSTTMFSVQSIDIPAQSPLHGLTAITSSKFSAVRFLMNTSLAPTPGSIPSVLNGSMGIAPAAVSSSAHFWIPASSDGASCMNGGSSSSGEVGWVGYGKELAAAAEAAADVLSLPSLSVCCLNLNQPSSGITSPSRSCRPASLAWRRQSVQMVTLSMCTPVMLSKCMCMIGELRRVMLATLRPVPDVM
mmetsp:Transcript_71839/g.203455  ORF Transcript_71839/g.203455 Transcript_71839/m.203455 type:complete len:260 (+) Transcript_71839:760-1539(+)